VSVRMEYIQDEVECCECLTQTIYLRDIDILK
jgi:hypothetical protein